MHIPAQRERKSFVRWPDPPTQTKAASTFSSGAQHNQALFAFKLAREMTGRLIAAYSSVGSRVALSSDSVFGEAFTQAKARVRNMDLRFVEEVDPTRQALLEIYVSVVLYTKYNDFDTH